MWTEQDSARFRDFNAQSNGKLIRLLRSSIPPLLGKTIESVALEAKHKEGCEYIISIMEDMLNDKRENADVTHGTYTNM